MVDPKYPYYTEADEREAETIDRFEDLSPIAYKVLLRVPEPVAMVLGPISTGGSGSKEKNLEIFDNHVHALYKQGIHVFNQLPFETHLWRIIKNKEYFRNEMQLLIGFYRPLFESGRIKTVYFIPGWETSIGASWEHDEVKRLGIAIVYL